MAVRSERATVLARRPRDAADAPGSHALSRRLASAVAVVLLLAQALPVLAAGPTPAIGLTVNNGIVNGSYVGFTASTQKLTTAGKTDWRLWGRSSTSLSGDARKSTGSGISSLTRVIGSPVISNASLRALGSCCNLTWGNGVNTVPFAFDWSDGSSTAPTGSSVLAGLQHYAGTSPLVGYGFSLTVPATTAPQRLTLWVHAHHGTGALTAAIGSVTKTDPGVPGGENYGRIYTLDFQGDGTTGQVMTVTYLLASAGTNTNASNVAVYAAALAPLPDFTIAASPASLTIPQAGQGSSTLSIAPVGSAAGTVALAAATSNPGLTATLSAPTFSLGSATQPSLTVAAAANLLPGSYTATVTGTLGSVVHATTVAVTVPTVDFSIAAKPTSLSLPPGASGASVISTTQLGSPGTVSLAASVSPSTQGVTATLDAASVAAGGSANLTLTTSSTAVPGSSYTVTVTGTEGNATHAATVAVTIPAADFTIAAAPATLTMLPGGNGTSAITTTLVGSAGSVGLAAGVTGPSQGVTASFDAAAVAAGSGTNLTVAATAGATPGVYTVTVTGTEGTFIHAAPVTVTVLVPPDFTIAATPATQVIPQGGSATSAVNIAAAGTSTGTVTLVPTSDPGLTATLDTTSFVLGSATAPTLTLTVPSSTAPGTYTATVTGTLGLITHASTVTVTVPPADFTISAGPATQAVIRGTSGTGTVSTIQVGSPGTVALSAAVTDSSNNATSAVTASIAPTSVAAGGSATITVNAAATAAAGAYTLTITGTEGATTHTATVEVDVNLDENVPLFYRAYPTSATQTKVEGVLWADPNTTFAVKLYSATSCTGANSQLTGPTPAATISGVTTDASGRADISATVDWAPGAGSTAYIAGEVTPPPGTSNLGPCIVVTAPNDTWTERHDARHQRLDDRLPRRLRALALVPVPHPARRQRIGDPLRAPTAGRSRPTTTCSCSPTSRRRTRR